MKSDDRPLRITFDIRLAPGDQVMVDNAPKAVESWRQTNATCYECNGRSIKVALEKVRAR